MLLDSIADVATEALLLNSDDPAAQSQTNTWWLSADPEERAMLSVQQIAAAFEHTARVLRRRIYDLGFQGTATFYVWHDEQAGQLRCSTSSQPPNTLPFRGTYTAIETLDPIVEPFLNDNTPGLLPWAELTAEPDATDRAEDEPIPPPFLVWTRSVGQRS
jgi:hypothetical protein